MDLCEKDNSHMDTYIMMGLSHNPSYYFSNTVKHSLISALLNPNLDQIEKLWD